jgi:PPOX class probable F420-dependent enzyme
LSLTLSDDARALLEAPNIAWLVTLNRDGSPQSTPVWVDYDGRHVLVNTAEGRQKPRNLRRDPRVAVCVIDPANPYRWVSISGRVASMEREGADAHIDKLAKKYLGRESYPMRRGGETRVIIRIEPERVLGIR